MDGYEIVANPSPVTDLEPFGESVESIELMKSERIGGKLTYTAIYKARRRRNGTTQCDERRVLSRIAFVRRFPKIKNAVKFQEKLNGVTQYLIFRCTIPYPMEYCGVRFHLPVLMN